MSADFIESPRFPTTLSYGARGGPRFKTSIVALASGREQRNMVWSKVRAEYDISHVNRTAAELETLEDFFFSARGAARGFRFKDHKDFRVTVARGIVKDDGASPSELKLHKRYGLPGYTYDRRIYKPVSGTVTIYQNGAAVPWSVDYTTGLVTPMGSPSWNPAAELTWSGEFDVPVRLDTDAFDASIDELDAHTWQSVKLVEMRFD